MSILDPVYAKFLVVGIIYKGNFDWYVLNRNFCILDYNKWDFAVISVSSIDEDPTQLPPDEENRYGIVTLDENTVDLFLEKAKKHKADDSELIESIITAPDRSDREDCYPTILIDFDKKELYSWYPEYIEFENYVPDGWTGEYGNFFSLIPESRHFWINEKGENIISYDD